MNKTNAPRTTNQEQRRLLEMMGWRHGEALNENVKGLLGWTFGTRGETVDAQGRRFGKLLPGMSVFLIPPVKMAQWIMFYLDTKVTKEALLAVRMDYSVVPQVEKQLAGKV